MTDEQQLIQKLYKQMSLSLKGYNFLFIKGF